VRENDCNSNGPQERANLRPRSIDQLHDATGVRSPGVLAKDLQILKRPFVDIHGNCRQIRPFPAGLFEITQACVVNSFMP
jgi:hypothetical protein